MATKPTTKQMKKVMESRFGFAIDYSNLTLKRAYTMARAISESLDKIKRTHSAHTLEKNPKYMEMFMVRESLHNWMIENKTQFIAESEMAKSQAILAAKDMVDSIQDMLEKISKMQNEQLPALLDTIRDQISTEQAEAYKGAVSPLLQNLAQTLQQGRETADGAARALAGEQTDQDMGMGAAPGMDGAAGPDLGPGMGGETSDLDMGGDEFGATDASAGGNAELGREMRGESKVASKKKIDELSPNTLANYAGKARSQGQWANGVDQYNKSAGSRDQGHGKLADKRFAGAAKAEKKAGVGQQTPVKNNPAGYY